MKTSAAFALVLLSFCAPALADPAPPAPESVAVRFAVHDGTATRRFTVIVGVRHPCATASERRADHYLELKACASIDSQLDVEWLARSSAGEYRSTSSIPLVHGATVELGSESGPRLEVAIQ